MKLLFSSFLCYYYLASSSSLLPGSGGGGGISGHHACWAFAPSTTSWPSHPRRQSQSLYQYQQQQQQRSLSSLGMVAGSSSSSGELTTDPSSSSSSSASPDSSKNINNDELVRRRELAFQQVLKEVGMVKEYLSWLITSSSSDGSSSGGGGSDSENAATFGEILADKKAASSSSAGGSSVVDMVELLGGSSSTTTSSSSTSSTTTTTASSSSKPSSSTECYHHPTYRSNLGTTILLSGTTDATLLSYLNNNFFGQSVLPNMNFSTIRALVQDVALAKKGAISREARYGGLLDKLVIEPLKSSSSSSSSVLPTQEELEGATSWIVQLSPPTTDESSLSLVSMMKEVARLASTSSTLTNVILMVVAPANDDDSHASSEVVEGWNAILESSNNNNFKATLLSVGELYDGGNEGGFYHIGPLSAATAIAPASAASATTTTTSTTSTSSSKLSRKKAYQLLAHMLALDTTSQQAYVAYEYPSSDNAMMEMIASPYAEGEFAVVVRDDDESGKEVMEGVDENKDIKMTCRMIQAMRELGFTQVMELDVLVGKGIESYKEYLANPPNKENVFSAIQTARDEEDERIMKMLQEESAKKQSMTSEQTEKEKQIAIEGIAKEWAIKEYTLRMLNGVIDDSLSEKDFLVSVWDEALSEGRKTYELINSKEYSREQENRQKSMAGIEDKLFWEGMPPLIRKKREKMVEKVKKQYMDLLSEEELEKIILMSE